LTGKPETVTAENWAQLLEEVYRDAWNPDLRRYRSPYVFRGAGTREGNLISRLLRLCSRPDGARAMERHLLRNFRKYSSAEFPNAGSEWIWLTLAQHYGLPTRLLDWTYSPLVAFHFATEDPRLYDCDASVWCIDHAQSNRLLPSVLRDVAAREGADVFTAEMLDVVAPQLERFDSLCEDRLVLFLEPPSLDTRIVNQFALFSMMSPPEATLTEWLAEHPETAREIVIPAAAKREIRDKLDQSGITERMIYPGPDGIARWLTRYYREI
jgi:hypothetical protein